MTAYRYEAALADGSRARGLIDATGPEEAAAALSARGLYPLAVDVSVIGTQLFVRRPSVQEQAIAFQCLASLVEAGVALQHALHAAAQSASGRLSAALQSVAGNVREGDALGSALGRHPDVFDPITIGLVHAGERGVGLAPGLQQAAEQLERDAQARGRIRAALAYPTLLGIVGLASIALIAFFIVPRFASILADAGQSLPPATRLLLALSDNVRHYGWIGAAVIAIGLGLAVHAVRSRRAAWHAWLLHLPFIGGIRHRIATVRAARALGTLLGSGTPALTALEIAGHSAGDAAVAMRLASARARVTEGASVSDALRETSALTPLAVQLATIGDRSGRLPALLVKASNIEERDAEGRVKALLAMLEPAMILGFAAVVAFVAAALLQAVYALRPGGGA